MDSLHQQATDRKAAQQILDSYRKSYHKALRDAKHSRDETDRQHWLKTAAWLETKISEWIRIVACM
jgi:hypothetical protein